MSEHQTGARTPHEAARGRRPYARVIRLDESPDEQYAVALVDKGAPGKPYPLEVVCQRVADGWEDLTNTNGHGWTALPKQDADGNNVGVLTLWGEAPPGVESVTIRWRDHTLATPVVSGYFLFVSWDVPDRESNDLPHVAKA